MASFLSGEFLIHMPCWLNFYLRSLFYRSHAGFTFLWGVSLTPPVLASFLCGEFLLHFPCCLHFYRQGISLTPRVLGSCFVFVLFVCLFCCCCFHLLSFSYTSRAGLFSLLGEILLHIPCWLPFYPKCFLHIPSWPHFCLGTISYTSQAGLIFLVWGLSPTHPVMASFLSGEFLLHIPCRL